MKSAHSAAILAKIQSATPFAIADAERAIRFVASAEAWDYCEERLSAAVIVGVDTETRPIFYYTRGPNLTSLLQLAVRYADGSVEVFVLDLLALEPSTYNAALTTLFRSELVIKLGQSLSGDLKELYRAYPSASCFGIANAVVEVNDLSNTLAGPHSRMSLQKLTYFYLNKSLNKSQQISNWDQRPLSFSQLHYAASDALVLIEIYDELMAHLHVQSNGQFQIQFVMWTLHAIAMPPPTCNFCHRVFETRTMLNIHKRQCIKAERRLTLCPMCDTLLLLDTAALDAHTSSCFQYT